MTQYAWTVIGAGPAGIAAVGRLLDHGVTPERIAWIDPEFEAGDLGAKWRAVPSNTQVALFLDYVNASPSFGFESAPHFELSDLDPHQTCALGVVADPLVWISHRLAEQVRAQRTTATELCLRDRRWTVTTPQGPILSDNVILAVGSVAEKLSYPGLDEIPLEVALDPCRLADLSLDGATVAVFGSSHSAMIALPNLLARPLKKVVNFYRSPLRYAVHFDEWTLFDDTGLKGSAACWARQSIDGKYPERLERISVHDERFHDELASCDRVVYAVGFRRRQLPATPQWGTLEGNPRNGILAPGLFGVGIAYPEYATDPYGVGGHRVGLQKFMARLNTVLPLWRSYGSS